MIAWFTYTLIAIAVAAGVLGVAWTIRGKAPSDPLIGAAAMVETLVVVQVVLAIMLPFFGNEPTGNGVEYWAYLISAALLVPLAVFLGLVERTRWASLVIAIAALAVAIMEWRMWVIWTIQIA